MSARVREFLLCLSVAATLVSLLFFDVLFLRASLQPSNLAAHIGPPDTLQYVSLRDPDFAERTASQGFYDVGSTAWQSEPARHFVARSLREEGELPYWNPYSANGSLAPDTLADLKFSPFTLLTAGLFNASAASFDFGLLIVFIVGCTCMLLISRQYLGLGPWPALATAIIFLLNGFATANLNSQNGQAYFLAPLLLLALMRWSERPDSKRWVEMTLCHALMLLSSMLPVTLMCLITCHTLHLAWRSAQRPSSAMSCTLAATALSALTALLLTAFLWLPVLVHLRDTSLFSDYSARSVMEAFHWHNLIAIISPLHFWESYNGVRPLELLREKQIQHDWGMIAHLGLGALLIITGSLARPLWRPHQTSTLLIFLWLLLLLPYARIFGLLPFVDHIPGIAFVGRQYWMSMSALSASLLGGIGLQQWITGAGSRSAIAMTFVFAGGIFLLLLHKIGIPEEQPHHIHVYRYAAYLAGFLGLTILYWRLPRYRELLAILLLLASTTELVTNMNPLRAVRFDANLQPPAFVRFLQTHLGNYRVLNIGETRTLQPEFGTQYGIRQLDTNNSSLLPRYKRFYNQAFGTQNPLFLLLGSATLHAAKPLQPQILDRNSLDIASARYLVVSPAAEIYVAFLRKLQMPEVFSSPHTLIFENTTARPIAYSASQWFSGDDLTAIAGKPNAIVTDDPAFIRELEALPAMGEACPPPEILQYRNNSVTYVTRCSHPQILATSETWHPDWQTDIDGKTAITGRINQAFKGVAVPAGNHRITCRFGKNLISTGQWLSIFTLILTTIIWLVHTIRALVKSRRLT